MLTGYYGLFDPRKFDQPPGPDNPLGYLTAALQYNSFAPMMTMFVRTLAEILTELPANSPDNGQRAAPVFNVPEADLQRLRIAPTPDSDYGKASFYGERLTALVQGVKQLATVPGLPSGAQQRLGFMAQNITRLAANFTTIDASGIYADWKPSVPDLSPQ